MLYSSDLTQIKKLLVAEIDPLKKDLGSLKTDIKDVKKRVRKTEKTVDIMIDLFDKEIVGTQKRVTRIEEHLRI